MGYRIQNRRDTAERWAEVNPILLEGEIGYVTDNPNQHKIGDGVHHWNDLPLRGYTGTIAQELGNDENAVVSQKAVTEKLSELGSEVNECPTISYNEVADLDVTDESGNVIARIVEGHFMTKNFDTRKAATKKEVEDAKAPLNVNNAVDKDFAITDERGNAIVEFGNGHIKTKKFNSADLDRGGLEKTSYGKIHILSDLNIRNVSSKSEVSKIYGRNRFDINNVSIKKNNSNIDFTIIKEDNGVMLDGSKITSDRYNTNAYAYFDYTAEFTGVLYIGCVSHPVDTFGVTSRLNVEDRDNALNPSANCRGIGSLKMKLNVVEGQRLRVSLYVHQTGTESPTSAKYSDIMIAYYDYEDYVPFNDSKTDLSQVAQGDIIELAEESELAYHYEPQKPHKKTMVCFGDSITGLFGYGTSYPEIITKSTDVEAVNCGFSGSTACDHNSTNYIPFSLNRLADAIVSGDYSTQDNKVGAIDSDWYAEHLLNLKGIDWMSVNYISVLIGTNDWAFGKIINSKDDSSELNKQRTNVEDAIRYFISNVIGKYPHIKAVIISPPSRYNYSGGNDSNTQPNNNSVYLREVVEMEERIAKEFNLPFINLYDALSCNVINSRFILYDGTHPSDSTRRDIANIIINKLNIN